MGLSEQRLSETVKYWLCVYNNANYHLFRAFIHRLGEALLRLALLRLALFRLGCSAAGLRYAFRGGGRIIYGGVCAAGERCGVPPRMNRSRRDKSQA